MEVCELCSDQKYLNKSKLTLLILFIIFIYFLSYFMNTILYGLC